MQKVLIILLCLMPTTVLAGSFVSTWPEIGKQKAAIDAITCATAALTRTDQDHRCYEVGSANTSSTSAYAAECRFVMALSAKKTVWRLDGSYDANQVFTGTIIQTLPTCTGFLCGYMGSVTWTGRSPSFVKEYYYNWISGNTAGCEIAPINGQVKGLFYGSY